MSEAVSARPGGGEGDTRALPPATELLLHFVNTHADAGGRPERFGDGAALAAWVEEAGLQDGQTVVTSADAAMAREIRDALVTVLLTRSGDESTTEDDLRAAEEHLRRTAARHPLVCVVTAGGVGLTSGQTGAPRIFGTILSAVAELAQRGEWERIKACRNPPCHFGFVDRTRNASAAFCSPGCRSQVSMRAYRQRQKSR